MEIGKSLVGLAQLTIATHWSQLIVFVISLSFATRSGDKEVVTPKSSTTSLLMYNGFKVRVGFSFAEHRSSFSTSSDKRTSERTSRVKECTGLVYLEKTEPTLCALTFKRNHPEGVQVGET